MPHYTNCSIQVAFRRKNGPCHLLLRRIVDAEKKQYSYIIFAKKVGNKYEKASEATRAFFFITRAPFHFCNEYKQRRKGRRAFVSGTDDCPSRKARIFPLRVRDCCECELFSDGVHCEDFFRFLNDRKRPVFICFFSVNSFDDGRVN